MGSGKTSLAYLLTREFCRQGWGWIWVSIKPQIRRSATETPRVLDYLPPAATDRCLVFAPYSANRLNFVRSYLDPEDTAAATEREMLSDQTAELFAASIPR